MKQICKACRGKGYHMMPLMKTRMDCPVCDGAGYVVKESTPEQIATNVTLISEYDYSEIIELVEKHYGSGKAMQVADILRDE